jgi:HK97 family phage portal protein
MAILWASWMRRLWDGLWNPERGVQLSGPQRISADSGVVVTDARAMQIAAAFRCIRIIAETGSSLPLVVYRREGDHGVPAPDHWLSKLLNEPNETMTGDELREAWLAHMAGWGNSYTEIVRDGSRERRPVELWPLRVEKVEVERMADRRLIYKYPNADGVPQRLEASRILHHRAFSADGVIGLSPLALARESLGLTVGAEQYAASFFAQGGRPAGVLTSERLLSEKQREQIRKEFSGLADGNSDGKRLWVLEAGLKYQAITVSPEDMQMLATRQFQIAEIARFFGVPLFLLMVQENTPNWGLEQHDLAFLKYGLRPYLTRIEQDISRWLLSPKERETYYVQHDLTQFLAADSKAQAEYLSTLVNNGLNTRNEARQVLGKPPLPGGDTLTVQSALVPLSTLGQQRPPATGVQQ